MYFFTRTKKAVGVFILSAGLCIAQNSVANAENYSILNAPFHYHNDQTTLKDVVVNLKETYGVNFAYPEKIDDSQLISISLEGTSLEEVIQQLAKQTGLKIQVVGNTVILKNNKPVSTEEQEVLIKKIKGAVYDKNKEPILGATVSVVGTTIGAITDVNGEFMLEVPNQGELKVSFIGFHDQIIVIGNQTSIEIYLKENSKELEEVVVIGYGESKRGDLSSSIATVKLDDVETNLSPSPNEMLQGQVAGVNIQGNGAPGSASRVSIRGVSSINGANEPLYVVDGVPLSSNSASTLTVGDYRQDPLSMINPNDIESIEVLKDAAASAIYGSRATNGVILITTKKGSEGKIKVNFSTKTGFQSLPTTIDMLDSDSYISLQREASNNYNNDMGYKPGDNGYVDVNNVLGNVPDHPQTLDWLGMVTNQNALITDNNLSLSGGGENHLFYISTNYFNQDGLLPGTNLERFSLRANIEMDLNRWLKVGALMNISQSTGYAQANGNVGTGVLRRAIEQRPYDSPYLEDGSFAIGGQHILRHNGIQVLENEETVNKNVMNLMTFFAEAQLAEGLKFRSTVNSETRNVNSFNHQTMKHPYAFGVGKRTERTDNINSLLFENFMTYNKEVFSKLNMSLMGGHSFNSYQNKYVQGYGENFPSDDFKNLGSATHTTSTAAISYNYLNSFISRANFNYDDRYLFNANVRYDGSSKFAEGNRYGFFPSASVGWVPTNENFFPEVEAISSMKIRSSYGLTGNQAGIGNFSYIPTAVGGYNYNGGTGMMVTNIGNPDLKWETATQFNIGTDLMMFNGRLKVTYDFFIKDTHDLLFDRPTLATSGFTTQTVNIGSMRNRGHEINISTLNIEKKDFSWTSDFNISKIKNEVTQLVDNSPYRYGSWNVLKVGESIGSFYTVKTDGIYQTVDEIPEKLYAQGVRPGDFRYLDVNGDGIINDEDRQVTGSALPDFYGGLTNTFKYKNFSLSILATFSVGNDVVADWRRDSDHMGAMDYNQLRSSYENRWTGPGTSNDVPRATKGGQNHLFSDYYIEDGSYLRIQNVTFAYNLPNHIATKVGLGSAQISVSGQNLYTFTKYSGFSPDASSSLDAKSYGVDFLQIPNPRSIIFGLNLQF